MYFFDLSTEIRRNILSHVLVSRSRYIDPELCHGRSHCLYCERYFSVCKDFYRLCLVSRSLHGDACDVFFRKNTFAIYPCLDRIT